MRRGRVPAAALGLTACVALSACEGDGPALPQRLALDSVFNALDTDGDGVLTAADFVEEGRTHRINGEELNAIAARDWYFEQCDADEDGQITRQEFYRCLA